MSIIDEAIFRLNVTSDALPSHRVNTTMYEKVALSESYLDVTFRINTISKRNISLLREAILSDVTDEFIEGDSTLKPDWWYDLPEEQAYHVDRFAELIPVEDDSERFSVRSNLMQERLLTYYARRYEDLYSDTGWVRTLKSDDYLDTMHELAINALFPEYDGAIPYIMKMSDALNRLGIDDAELTPDDGDYAVVTPLDINWGQRGE